MDAPGLEALVLALRGRGYAVHAPTLERGNLAIRRIESAADLPVGVIDEQAPGSHRLRQEGERRFDYTVPADSWKRLFFPPRLSLWRAAPAGDGFEIASAEAERPPLALLGVRACDLAAIQIQDRVFLGGQHPDPDYRARREGAFIVAVNCARATSTCFCTSMGTGPKAHQGFDLALTELPDGRLLVEAGTGGGAEVLAELPGRPAADRDMGEAESILAATAQSISRTMPEGIGATLASSVASPRWKSIADRCLSCGNCTLVCPTCFCWAVEHTTELSGAAVQERRWDSCFSASHSYIHGGSVRASTAPRYRQWLTHKLSTWQEHFGTSGCSGCGRCITWCPVGIDITAEGHAFTADLAGGGS